MKLFRLALLALAFVGIAHARPLAIQEAAFIEPPDATWDAFGRFGVAIDGDWALISGERYVTDPESENGVRHDGAAYLYQRVGNTWTHVGQLGITRNISEWQRPGLAMKNGIAVVIAGGTYIYERVGGSWVPATVAPGALTNLQGADIEIDGDRILVTIISSLNRSAVLRRVNGVWTREGELAGHSNDGGDTPPYAQQDIQGNRAVVFNEEGINFEPPRARLYQFNGTWNEVGGIATSAPQVGPGPGVAFNGPYIALIGTRERGNSLYYWPIGGAPTLTKYSLQPLNAYLGYSFSAWTLKRMGPLFAARTAEPDKGGYVIDLFRINDDAVHSNTQVATLFSTDERFIGGRMDASGNRVIVNSYEESDTFGYKVVRIYELPQEFTTPPVQVHDFESPASAAAWQPSAGSFFSVVKVGYTNVYRQRSATGSAYSLLPATQTTNQSIQAEVNFKTTASTGGWVGLVTRRSDDSNYYYAALLSNGRVEIRRVLNGALKTLWSQPIAVQVGARYRLRLESIGDLHRVFVNDKLQGSAVDDSLEQGVVGVRTFRATAEFDNVIVSPNWFTTLFANGFEPIDAPKIWYQRGGQWSLASGAMRQSYTDGYARAFTAPRSDDQIVQVRVKPTSFVAPENWVGVFARWQDERNHLYVSLAQRGVISLWRRTNGVIQQLATQRFPVTVGQWYTLRVEVVNGLTRVFVDGQEILKSSADPGPTSTDGTPQKGNVGLITYRATADFDDFLAYQP